MIQTPLSNALEVNLFSAILFRDHLSGYDVTPQYRVYEQDVVADVSTQLTLGDFDIPDAVLIRCPTCRKLHE